jgi:hypothetical protein
VETYQLTLEQLHRYHTRKQLHSVYLKHGEAQFNLLWDAYASIRAHGYSYSEVVNEEVI